MTDQEIINIIAQGIVDGTDLDCTAETQAREVLRQLRAAGVLPQWQPIETAPKDGTVFDIWVAGAGRIVNVKHARAYHGATHWQPRPEAPQ